MSDSGTIWLPEGASSIAPEFDALFYFVFWVSVVIFVGVVATMLYFAYKYRRKNPSERPEPVEENTAVEVSWVVIPTILVLIVFTWGFQTYVNMGTSPPEAYEIRVEGYQWGWDFEYPNGMETVNELHVPKDRPVRLTMTSQDVIHSFFIPAFRVEYSVLPNRRTTMWFEPTEEGTYTAYCNEYCGTQHARMLADVHVHPQDEFEDRLAEAGEPVDLPLPELGARLHEQRCQQCHSIDGSDGVGPTFAGLFGRDRDLQDGRTVEADEDYIRTMIIDPTEMVVEGYQSGVMPSFAHLDEREIEGLIEYIKTLEEDE